MNFEKLVRQVVAESDGAQREREMHELQQQYESPAWEGDNRQPKPGQQDAETVQRLDKAKWDAYHAISELLKDGTPFAMVMGAAMEVGDMENEDVMLQASRAIASNKPGTHEWFSRLADALEVFLDTQRTLRDADPDEIRHNGFKPKAAAALMTKCPKCGDMFDDEWGSETCLACDRGKPEYVGMDDIDTEAEQKWRSTSLPARAKQRKLSPDRGGKGR